MGISLELELSNIHVGYFRGGLVRQGMAGYGQNNKEVKIEHGLVRENNKSVKIEQRAHGAGR